MRRKGSGRIAFSIALSFEIVPGEISGDAIAFLSFLAFGAISYCLVLDVFVNRNRSSVQRKRERERKRLKTRAKIHLITSSRTIFHSVIEKYSARAFSRHFFSCKENVTN